MDVTSKACIHYGRYVKSLIKYWTSRPKLDYTLDAKSELATHFRRYVLSLFIRDWRHDQSLLRNLDVTSKVWQHFGRHVQILYTLWTPWLNLPHTLDVTSNHCIYAMDVTSNVCHTLWTSLWQQFGRHLQSLYTLWTPWLNLPHTLVDVIWP